MITPLALLLASTLAAAPPAAAGPAVPASQPGRVAALERQIAELQARLDAVEARRDQAEQDRQQALAQRQEVLGELAGIRQELAAAQAREAQTAAAQARVQAELDDIAGALREADAELAIGSTTGVDGALSSAARAFADAHDRPGAVRMQEARDALARSDLHAVRLAIAGALQSLPAGQPAR